MRKDCMARELTVEVVVGVFVVMVLLGLGLFTIILSGNSLRKSQYPVQVLFSSVMGLRDGDSIVVRGMPVGKVEDLELTAEGVLVEGRIVEKLDMRRDYRVTIVQTSVLGGRYLQIHEGSPEAPPLPAGIVLKGEEPYDLMEDAAELVSRLREAFVNGGVIADLEASASALRAVISRVHAGEGTVGRLLADEGALYSDLADAVSSLKVVSGRLESGEGTLGKLLSEDDTLYADLQAAVSSLKAVSGKLAGGEGTLGKLVSDDALYEDVRGLVNDTRAAVDDIRETSPVTTFTSIFFGVF